MKMISAASLILAGSALSTFKAHAVQVVTCGNCTQSWQYESAGEMAHGFRRGWEVYLVVNPHTAQALYVTVNYIPPGEVPRRLHPAPSLGELGIAADINVPGWRLPSQPVQTRDGQGDFDSSSQGLAEGERLQLEAVVRMSKEWVFIKPANDSGYFSSLHVANQFIPAVDDAIRIAHTASNPTWQHGQINGNLLGSLPITRALFRERRWRLPADGQRRHRLLADQSNGKRGGSTDQRYGQGYFRPGIT